MKRRGVITGFEVQGKRKQAIAVLLDGEPWATLDPETVVRARLERGMILSAESQARVLAEDHALLARRAAAGFLARGPRSRLEIEHNLRRKGFSHDATEAAIAALEASGTFDEAQSADAMVRRRRRSGHGPRRIEAELAAKGIAPRMVSSAIAKAIGETDLKIECEALARKAATKYEPLDDPAQRRKLTQYLLRRGYDGEMAAAAVAKACRKDACENS